MSNERLIILSPEEEAALAEQELKEALDELVGKTAGLVPATPVNLSGGPNVHYQKPNRKQRRAMAKLSRKKNRKKGKRQ